MNRTFLLKLTLVSLLTLGMFACGGGETKNETNATDTTAKKEDTNAQDTTKSVVDTASTAVDTSSQKTDTSANDQQPKTDDANSQLLGTWANADGTLSFTFSEGGKMKQGTFATEAVGTYSVKDKVLTVKGKFISHETNKPLDEKYTIAELKDKATLKLIGPLPAKHSTILKYQK